MAVGGPAAGATGAGAAMVPAREARTAMGLRSSPEPETGPALALLFLKCSGVLDGDTRMGRASARAWEKVGSGRQTKWSRCAGQARQERWRVARHALRASMHGWRQNHAAGPCPPPGWMAREGVAQLPGSSPGFARGFVAKPTENTEHGTPHAAACPWPPSPPAFGIAPNKVPEQDRAFCAASTVENSISAVLALFCLPPRMRTW